MKAKKIGIFYAINSFRSLAVTEHLFYTVLQTLVAEGRTIKTTVKNKLGIITTFECGTKITMQPFTENAKDLRLTHLYIDETILNLGGGDQYVRENLLPMVVGEGLYQNVEAFGKAVDRVEVYKLREGKIKFEKLKG